MAFLSSSSVTSFFFPLVVRLITMMKTITATRRKKKTEVSYSREQNGVIITGTKLDNNIRLYRLTDFFIWGLVRLTAESKNAAQDPDGGSHPVTEGTFFWCDVAVAQLCAVTYSHWCREQRATHVPIKRLPEMWRAVKCHYLTLNRVAEVNLSISNIQQIPWKDTNQQRVSPSSTTKPVSVYMSLFFFLL